MKCTNPRKTARNEKGVCKVMAVREYGVWSKLTGWAREDKTRGRERTEISDED